MLGLLQADDVCILGEHDTQFLNFYFKGIVARNFLWQ